MSEEVKTATHGRLMTRFAQIGPYLRHKKSSPDQYFFDCLAACVNAQKAPEKREFWGWWFFLTPREDGFEYQYQYGKFDTKGEWVSEKAPEKMKKDIVDSLDTFYEKLTNVCDEFTLSLQSSAELKEKKLN